MVDTLRSTLRLVLTLAAVATVAVLLLAGSPAHAATRSSAPEVSSNVIEVSSTVIERPASRAVWSSLRWAR